MSKRFPIPIFATTLKIESAEYKLSKLKELIMELNYQLVKLIGISADLELKLRQDKIPIEEIHKSEKEIEKIINNYKEKGIIK